MQKKRSIKIISIVLILVLICISITYLKNDSKVVLATTSEFNSENLQNNEHMHVELDNSGDKVPVPNGYIGSKAKGENEIDTGYVIYEGTEEVNDSNVDEAQKTRNQYVWIPVPDASTMYGTDANGKKWGKLYNFATSSNNVNYNEVTGTYPLNWSENNEIMQVTSRTTYREPDVVTKEDIDSKIKSLNSEDTAMHELLIQFENEFNIMMDSIEKYGGFYIGRYETGNLSKNIAAVVRKGNEDINNQTWYTMYKKCKTLKNKNTNIETGIIWGNQWDRTLMWLVESGNKTKEEICVNSTSWGNYYNATFKYMNSNGILVTKDKIRKIIPTGSTEYTKANNIYDLAGNIGDWTMEANYRVARGGSYYDLGNQYYASVRYPNQQINVLNYRRMPSNALYKIKQEVANNFKKRNY